MRFTLERSRRVHRGRVFDVCVNDVRFSDGRRTKIDVIEHPGAVAIVPMLTADRVLLIRQLRVPTRRVLFEIPAGTREKGEAPMTTARRELIEEIGYRATSMKKVSEFYTAPGFCNELLRVYVARGLRPAYARGDEDERIQVYPVSRTQALRMVRTGRIRDAKSIIGILTALKPS